MNEKKSLGTFLAHLRKENNLTQSKLGELLAVSDKTISRWENDLALPDMEMLINLSKIFNVSLEELTNGKRSELIEEDIKIEKNSKLDKHINKILVATIFIVLIDIIIIFFIYFYNNYNKYSVYKFSSIDSEYYIVGNLVEIPDKKIIYIDSINNHTLKYSYDENVLVYKYSLENDGDLVFDEDFGYFAYEIPSNKEEKKKYKTVGNLSDVLANIHFLAETENSRKNKNKINYSENMYIFKFVYVNEYFETKQIVIPLILEKLHSNDKFMYNEK